MNTPTITLNWNHSEPTQAMQQYDLQLMTTMGISVLGRWCGHLGEFYVGWTPLLGAAFSQLKAYPSEQLEFDMLMKPEKVIYVN